MHKKKQASPDTLTLILTELEHLCDTTARILAHLTEGVGPEPDPIAAAVETVFEDR